MFTNITTVEIFVRLGRYNYNFKDVKMCPVFKFYLLYSLSASVVLLNNYIEFPEWMRL